MPELERRTGAEQAASKDASKDRRTMPGQNGSPATRTARQVISVEDGAQAFLEVVTALGVKYWFVNPGTDWPGFINAAARKVAAGEQWPKFWAVPHEFVAASMAHGYAMVSGYPAAVGLHSIVGPSNAHAAIANAFTARIPMLLVGGRRSWTPAGMRGSNVSPIGQETYDQGGLIRQYVKYDYELKDLSQIHGVLQRALQIAKSEPQGPVYVVLPAELSLTSAVQTTIEPQELFQPNTPANGDPAVLQRVAQLLVDATNPLIIVGGGMGGNLGRDPEAVHQLRRLAELLSIPVSGGLDSYMNFPTDHPLSLSLSPSDADVVFVIDNPAPWPTDALGIVPNQNARYIYLDSDPLYAQAYPFSRFFPADISIQANSAIALTDIFRRASELINSGMKSALQDRAAKIKRFHNAEAKALVDAGLGTQNVTPIDVAWLGYCVGQIIDPGDTIVVNELGAFRPATINRPKSYFSYAPSASLGWGLGAALGAKLAAPDKTVIATVGDGSYMYGVPTVAYFTARKYSLPFLTVIHNNGCWGAIKAGVDRMFPNGYEIQNKIEVGSDLYFEKSGDRPALEKVVDVAGGYGEMVTDPAHLPSALQRGLNAVSQGKPAVLNVICAHAQIPAA